YRVVARATRPRHAARRPARHLVGGGRSETPRGSPTDATTGAVRRRDRAATGRGPRWAAPQRARAATDDVDPRQGDQAHPWLRRDGMTLNELLACDVVDSSGEVVGQVHDVSFGGRDDGPAPASEVRHLVLAP